MPVRILHIVEALGVGGGVEHGLANLIERLDPERFENIVCAVFRLGPLLDRYPAERVRVICLNQKGRLQIGALARVIREVKPTVMHSRNWSTLEAVMAGRWVRSCAVIHSEHGVEMTPEAEPRRRTWLRRIGFELAHRVFSVSYQLREVLANRTGFPRQRIEVIHNGVEVAKFAANASNRRSFRKEQGISEREFVIGCVGRLNRIKDYPTLLSAAKLLVRSCAPWRLWIAGGGPERAALQELVAADSYLRECVRFLGPIQMDRVPEFLHSLDAYVLPSLWEGISNSLLEAMAAGLPVVASNVGGNPEVVIDGESGLLFPAGNPRELADRLMLLYSDCDARRRLARRAVERIQGEFSLDSMIHNYERMYAGFSRERES